MIREFTAAADGADDGLGSPWATWCAEQGATGIKISYVGLEGGVPQVGRNNFVGSLTEWLQEASKLHVICLKWLEKHPRVFPSSLSTLGPRCPPTR